MSDYRIFGMLEWQAQSLDRIAGALERALPEPIQPVIEVEAPESADAAIADYYNRKRAEAHRMSAELKLARDNDAAPGVIARLERRLEEARYVGD